jgi:hypothetical protein
VTYPDFDPAPVGDDVVPVDLRGPSGDPWQHLDVPAGWQPVADLAREVRQHIATLADRIVDCVGEEIPAYRTGPVPREDLAGSIHRNVEMILLGLAEGREPTSEEISVRRELGTRRAMQGMPIDALLGAYHVGYRELWRSLVRAVPPGDERSATQLLSAATLVWSWVHQLTDAIAAAHAATVRSVEARAVGARQRFVELLVGGDLAGSEADRLARSLGFAPGGPFVVTVLRGATDDLDAVELQRAVDALPGRHAVAARGAELVTVSQGGEDRDAVVAASRAAFPGSSIASGAQRTALHGARDSLSDAELTLAVTDSGGTATFEEAWLWATLTGAADRLRPLLASGTEVAASHPHLAEAVTAFAESGFSVSEAARRLGLHANTVAYRLDRWTELTGWDPRRFPGLLRSVAALRLRG